MAEAVRSSGSWPPPGPEGAPVLSRPWLPNACDDIGVRRDDNPSRLAVFDHDACSARADAGKRCANVPAGWTEAVRHVPRLRRATLVKMAGLGLCRGKMRQFDRLLAAIGLRHRAGADVVARLISAKVAFDTA